MQLLRRFLHRSDSNSRPNVKPGAGVPDHRSAKKQARNEGVKNVTDIDVKPSLKRGHHAVDVDLPPVRETPKRSGLSQG